jgi:hypothetical protein
MGSRGSGRFGDYNVPTGNTDLCSTPLKNVKLEDTAYSDYYVNHSTIPPVDTLVQVRLVLLSGRIAVEIVDTGETVGNLPTKYNYLITCIKLGKTYSGNVVSGSLTPIPYVVVDLNVI